MEKYLKRKIVEAPQAAPPESKRARVELFNADDVLHDPGCCKKIFDYPQNIRDEVRRVYLQRDPCQPRGYEYPQVEITSVLRRFNPSWVKWATKLEVMLLSPLNFKGYTLQFLAYGTFFCQGLAFRGHDESEDSSNRGNLEPLKFLAKNRKEVDKVVLCNAPRNLQLTSPETQKQIVHVAAKLTTKAIIDELGDDFFSILVDETCDISKKEQMALVIRYVTRGGNIVEHFLEIIHVEDTLAQSLKEVVVSLLGRNKMNLSRVRGQGYDGASNMREEFIGLKTLILRENESAYYIHCFAHQLQLTLVYIAKSNEDVD